MYVSFSVYTYDHQWNVCDTIYPWRRRFSDLKRQQAHVAREQQQAPGAGGTWGLPHGQPTGHLSVMMIFHVLITI